MDVDGPAVAHASADLADRLLRIAVADIRTAIHERVPAGRQS